MSENEKIDKKTEDKLASFKSLMDQYVSKLSGFIYLFELHVKNFNDHISSIEKRLDALEHPDLLASLKAFQHVRKDTNGL